MESNVFLESVTRDVSEIYSRLFDHHPFLSGEINFFVKEFEEKRNDKDVEGLFKILDKVVNIQEMQLDKTQSLADKHLTDLNRNLDLTLKKCDQILEKGNIETEVVSAERRVNRQKEWEQYLIEIAKKKENVIDTFKEKELEIRNYYSELEQKLHINE